MSGIDEIVARLRTADGKLKEAHEVVEGARAQTIHVTSQVASIGLANTANELHAANVVIQKSAESIVGLRKVVEEAIGRVIAAGKGTP